MAADPGLEPLLRTAPPIRDISEFDILLDGVFVDEFLDHPGPRVAVFPGHLAASRPQYLEWCLPGESTEQCGTK